MKIKIKNIFNNNDIDEQSEKINDRNLKRMDNSNIRTRRRGAYIEEEKKGKEINLNKYFDNLFKNKNKLSKGYYILLFCMLVLGGTSVGLTFKAYNLFAKEEYELYAGTDIEENEVISTISEVENVENEEGTALNEQEENIDINAAKAKVNTIEKTTSKKTTTQKALSFSIPISGEIQKIYSIDKVIYSKTLELWKTHDGIDISAEIGTNVKSIEKGTVEKVYDDSFYGITVVIDHGQGYKSSYSNLDKNTNVKAKDTVKKGQVIGKVSNTSIGEIKDDPHLHFSLFKDNNNVDPTYIFKQN